MPQTPADLMNGGVRLRETAANIFVALAYGCFAFSSADALATALRLSTALFFLKETLDTVFFLCRKLPKQVSYNVISWAVAIGGSVTPLLLRPSGTSDSTVGAVIQCVGLSLQVIAAISLNRSFGVVPANRGIKTSGMYRFVRHPLYFSYTITLVGFLLSNFSLKNLILFVLATGFQIVRICREEELLSDDRAYQEYAKKTRWKLAPYIY